jgi:hypothetical protein
MLQGEELMEDWLSLGDASLPVDKLLKRDGDQQVRRNNQNYAINISKENFEFIFFNFIENSTL